jgi:hypothetical protein
MVKTLAAAVLDHLLREQLTLRRPHHLAADLRDDGLEELLHEHVAEARQVLRLGRPLGLPDLPFWNARPGGGFLLPIT